MLGEVGAVREIILFLSFTFSSDLHFECREKAGFSPNHLTGAFQWCGEWRNATTKKPSCVFEEV